jgi:hypothetical protein
MGDRPPTFVVECFWPGVDEGAVDALDLRAAAAADALAAAGHPVRYAGSILLVEDEVVLCEFEGEEPAVRRASETAAIPFARIVRSTRSPHPDVRNR